MLIDFAEIGTADLINDLNWMIPLDHRGSTEIKFFDQKFYKSTICGVNICLIFQNRLDHRPPQSQVSREVTNVTERKHTHIGCLIIVDKYSGWASKSIWSIFFNFVAVDQADLIS